jgi:hypothetical protein
MTQPLNSDWTLRAIGRLKNNGFFISESCLNNSSVLHICNPITSLPFVWWFPWFWIFRQLYHMLPSTVLAKETFISSNPSHLWSTPLDLFPSPIPSIIAIHWRNVWEKRARGAVPSLYINGVTFLTHLKCCLRNVTDTQQATFSRLLPFSADWHLAALFSTPRYATENNIIKFFMD